MDFGLRFKNMRLAKGLTQQELAKSLGVSVVCIGNWERGARKPTMDALISIGRHLNVSLDSLLGMPTSSPNTNFILSPAEKSLLRDYQTLDRHGKRVVETVCSLEKERVSAAKETASKKVIDIQAVKSS